MPSQPLFDQLRAMSLLMSVDGGITRANVGEVAGMAAAIIVTGSAVFDGELPAKKMPSS